VGNAAGERPDCETNQTNGARGTRAGGEGSEGGVGVVSTAAQRRAAPRAAEVPASIQVERGLICGYHPVQRKGEEEEPCGEGS
jgi:hypothetical protein